jgi:hypothetical protein
MSPFRGADTDSGHSNASMSDFGLKPKPMPVIERVAAIAASPVDVPYTDTLRYPSLRTKPTPGTTRV